MNFYRVRLAPSLSVALALALVLCPSLSCYAYADDPSHGQETENERPEERGAVGSGDEPREVAEEPEVDGEAGEGAAEGEAAPPSLSEVPSGAGSGSGGASGSGLDGSPEDAYSSGGRDFESSVLHFLDDLVSISGEIADYFRSGSVGISPLADINSVYDQLVSLKTSIGSMLGMVEGSSAASNRKKWTLNGYTWSTAKVGISYLISWQVTQLQSILVNSDLSASRLRVADDYLNNLNSLLKKQWGYGYGGTVVLESNSPAAWLQKIRDRLSTSKSVIGLSDDEHNVSLLAGVVADTMRRQWGYGYGGTAVISSNSPAAWLSNINDNVSTISKSNSSVLGKILSGVDRAASYLTYDGRYPISETERLIYNFLVSNLKYGDYSIGLSAREIRNNLTFSSGTNNVASWIKSISENTSYEGKYPIGETQRLIYGLLLKNLSYGQYSVAESAREIRNGILRANELSSSHTDLVSKGFADLLQKLDGLTVEADVSIDLSGIESRLDAIKNLLVAAGLLENGKDLLDVIFGDLSGIGQAAATGAIQSAMESAFPFCIPALVKQLFGLLSYEGSAPVWEFDICGNPLVCDFSDFQLVADCTSWLSRLGLVLALLVNTRKFVFTVNGGGAS